MAHAPTLYLTCGLPGSGKTALAKRLEHDVPALRLTADEWLHELYPGISTPEAETAPAFIVGQLCTMVDLDGPLLAASDVPKGMRYEGSRVHAPEAALWG